MGCCISTCREPNSPNDLRLSPPASGKIADAGDRDPPQPEEETVKEVLSAETSIIPKPQSPPPTLPEAVAVEDRKPEAAPPRDEPRFEAKIEDVTIEATGARSAAAIPRSEEVSEISQVSDLNSVSESVETARDEEVASSNSRDCSTAVEVRRRPAAGSVPKLVGRERRPRSPDAAKNAAPSPDKRNRGALTQPGATAMATSRRRSPSPGGYRRDSGGGGGTAQRSRSPATRTEGGTARVVKNMSPKAKNAGKNAVAAAAAAQVTEEKSEAGDKPEGPAKVTNESLEDPSVSLECFIFL